MPRARVLMITQDRELDRRIVQEARALADGGYEVAILARSRGATDTAGEESGFPVTRVAVPGAAAVWGTLTGAHAFSRRALPHALAAAADVYHAHDLNTLEVAHRAASTRRAKLVYDAHELFPEIANPWIRLRKRSWARLERSLLPRADAALTVNDLLADELSRRYGVEPPLVLLNCPERPPGFDPAAHRRLLHDRLGLDPETRIVLYQGWFARGRGLGNLVRAAAHLPQGTAVVLLGYGAYGRRLRRLAAGRVHFVPAVPQEELLAHCASADVGVIPYQAVDLNHRLTSPNKLFDYVQAELPIVASDLPFLRRIVAGHDLGVVARLDAPRDYARAIEEVLARRDELRRNLRGVAARYTWAAEAPKLLGAYSLL